MNQSARYTAIVLILVGGFGGLIFGFNTGIISIAGDLIDAKFNTTSSLLQGVTRSAILCGACVGSLAASFIADALGRRKGIIVASAVALVATLLQAFTIDLWTFVATRVILGGAIGIIGVVCPLYISESAPPAKRGTYGVVFQLSITFGILLSFFVGYVIGTVTSSRATSSAPVVTDLDNNMKWRLMLASGCIYSVGLLVLGFKINETYQWLSKKGKGGERTPMRRPTEGGSLDDEIEEIYHQSQARSTGWGGFIACSNFKYIFLAIALAATLQLTGINTLMFYAPKVLKSSGFTHETLLSNLIGGWNFLTTFIAIILVERLGRRPLMLIGTGLICVSLLGIGSTMLFMDEKSSAYPILVAVGLAGFLAGFEAGPGCLFWVIVSEGFPESQRESASSFANVLQWVFNLLVTTTYPIMLDNIGAGYTFMTFGGIGIACFLYLIVFLKETRTV